MRYFRIFVVILAVAITLFRGFLFITKSDIDVGPVITCEKEEFYLECGQDLNQLLKYVSAYDKQDGEIKDIFFENYYYIYNGNRSKITFVAIDSDNNITKCERDLIYTDYIPPLLTMNSSGIFVATDDIDLSKIFSAEDKFDGDISNRVRIIGEAYKENAVGTFPMTARVCNSYGETTEIGFNLYSLKKPFSKTLNLSQNIIYLSENQEKPDFKAYISDCSDPIDNVTVDDSQLNLNQKGSYEVYYRIGSKNAEEAFNRLIVVVGEYS